MSDIVIRRAHALTAKAAKAAAERIAARLEDDFALAYEWNGNVLAFKRTGVSGELVVEPKEVRIRVRLGFLLSALKPRIEQEIHYYFEQNFGPDSGPRV